MKAQTRKPHTVTASVRNAETAANRAEKEADRAMCHQADASLYSDKAQEAATRAGQFAYNASLSADRACTAERHLRRKVKLNSILCVILILLMAIDIILNHC